jgi:hypothetical protein
MDNEQDIPLVYKRQERIANAALGHAEHPATIQLPSLARYVTLMNPIKNPISLSRAIQIRST